MINEQCLVKELDTYLSKLKKYTISPICSKSHAKYLQGKIDAYETVLAIIKHEPEIKK